MVDEDGLAVEKAARYGAGEGRGGDFDRARLVVGGADAAGANEAGGEGSSGNFIARRIKRIELAEGEVEFWGGQGWLRRMNNRRTCSSNISSTIIMVLRN